KGATRLYSVNVLVVDDHPLFRQGIRYALGNERDIAIIGDAASAEEALEMLRCTEPNVVLTDVNVPKMNGIEFTRLLRRVTPSVGSRCWSASPREAATKRSPTI